MAQDPLITNNFIDGCSYSPADPGELAAANDILARTLDGQFQLGIPHAARAELDHPNTPAQTKRVAANQIYSKPVPLTPPEQKVQAEIHRILTGVGKPDAMW